MANPIFFHIFALRKKTFNMGKLQFLMFAAFIMVVSKFLNKRSNRPSKEESRDSFVKDLDKLAEIIKNK